MTRKLNALSTVTALFAGLATVHGLPATAEAAPSEKTVAAQDVSPQMLAAMQRDLGLTEAQVHRRLAFEAMAARLETRLSKELGTTFGGAWLNEDGSQLIVGITDEASAALVRLAGAEPRLVARSKAQLERVMEELDRNAAHASPSIHTWYIDLPTNSVVVTAEDSGMSKSRAESFIALSSGAKDGTLRLVRSAEAPRPLYDTRGGDAYYPGNARCSIGFPVNGGFVTAGHCGGVGTNTSGSNGVAQGTVRGSSFPNDDYGWVQTNGSWASQPWVNNYAGGVDVVAGSNEAGVGASICRSGSTTGKRCGSIQAKNVTVNYSNGPVYGLTQTNICAEPGDSGGSWLSGNQAQGVTSGGSGNCTSGGTTFFQPVNEILGVYGLSLTTSGGSGKAFVSRFNGRCIDVPNASFSDGIQLQMWDCNGTAAQQWTFVGNTVQIGGKCLDVSGGATANGTAIQLWTCNGTAAQTFTLSGAGDLVSYLANKCVDISEGNPNLGAKLHLWECVGAANQKWDYR
ncbi:ricin-type beta-trefoil lectin domain protein [Stigmatella sp. ncwal1]|uniref:Ricin-type beta-trefoil lectin domain protein n=1 Tax=Stigmatella ashevillensis TaxID=2995309 RepID=A0ABT5DGR7_9BACT|nr:ricin-type beta-trefoil lectin domain protein [Stigmatella ashevillena]MDC0711556.1 ricin-type beta-trefoil lectin domain protein [Stigmatella ashevillena]